MLGRPSDVSHPEGRSKSQAHSHNDVPERPGTTLSAPTANDLLCETPQPHQMRGRVFHRLTRSLHTDHLERAWSR